MQEDNSNKRMFYKFIFLLAVALLIGVVYIWKWTADDPKEQDPEEMFRQGEQNDSEKPTGLDKEKIDEVLTDYEDNKDKTKEEDNQPKQDKKDVSLEQTYLESYGKQEIEQAKEQAQTVLALYLLQVTDWDKWKGTVTDHYLQSVQKELSHLTQENVKRELNEIELFASQPQEDDTITYGAFASWHVTVKGKSTSQPMKLYYITLEKEGDEWVVSDVTTPDKQNMEGEGKEEK